MAFRLKQVRLRNQVFELPIAPDAKENRIAILVGPNGAGKTSLLSALAYQFAGRRNPVSGDVETPSGEIAANSATGPERVVAQTFSPFSRFPSERRRVLRLEEYLHPKEELYAAIGFTRAMGLRGSASKDAVGRVARKLLTDASQSKPLGQSLIALGFLPKIALHYDRSPIGSDLNLDEQDAQVLEASIDRFLQYVQGKTRKSGEELRLAREIENQPRAQLAALLRRSIELVRVIQEPRQKDRDPMYALEIDLSASKVPTPTHTLEATLTLARMGLLRLGDCLLWPSGSRSDWYKSLLPHQHALSIVDASSGEQQLLSSLFGLVAETRDNSLILIDEPELSLHPAWQTQFLDLLAGALSSFTGCQIVIATHSPMIAQRGSELDVPIVTLDHGQQSFISQTRDSELSVDQTLLQVFDVPVRDSTYVGRLLLSLVMQAESAADRIPGVLDQLQSLKLMYEKATPADERTLRLIDDALEIVRLPTNEI